MAAADGEGAEDRAAERARGVESGEMEDATAAVAAEYAGMEEGEKGSVRATEAERVELEEERRAADEEEATEGGIEVADIEAGTEEGTRLRLTEEEERERVGVEEADARTWVEEEMEGRRGALSVSENCEVLPGG
jgi:hypothetical protein